MNDASKRTRVIVGACSLAVMTAALVLAFRGSSILDSGQTVRAEFVNVLNVVPQASDVRVAGVSVGRATAVETEDDVGVVTMSVDDDIELHADASARLRLKSFLGEKYIDLDPGRAEAPLEGTITLEQTATSADLGALLGAAGDSLDIPPEEITASLALGNDTLAAYGPDLGTGIAGARRALDGVVASRAELFGLLERSDALLSTLVGQQETIGDIAATAEATMSHARDFASANRPVLESVLADLDVLTASLESHEGDLHRVLEEAPTTLRLTRRLVNQLTNNVLCGGNPAPVGIVGLGPYLESDHRPEEKTPGEMGSC